MILTLPAGGPICQGVIKMKRDNGYYRYQRKRTIRRKDRILHFWGSDEKVASWERGAKGRLSKGKIHRSCPMCRRKSYDDPTARDKRAMRKATEMIQGLLREEVIPHEGDDLEKAE